MNSFDILLFPTGDPLGPNGNTVTVADGKIKNTGDFDLEITGGLTSIDSLTPDPPGGATCSTSDFGGSVDSIPATVVTPGSTLIPPFLVNILTKLGAPADCQGDTVSYTVTIDVTNP